MPIDLFDSSLGKYKRCIDRVITPEYRDYSCIAGGCFTEFNPESVYSKLFPNRFQQYQFGDGMDIYVPEYDIIENIVARKDIKNVEEFDYGYVKRVNFEESNEVTVWIYKMCYNIKDIISTFDFECVKIYYNYFENKVYATEWWLENNPTDFLLELKPNIKLERYLKYKMKRIANKNGVRKLYNESVDLFYKKLIDQSVSIEDIQNTIGFGLRDI